MRGSGSETVYCCKTKNTKGRARVRVVVGYGQLCTPSRTLGIRLTFNPGGVNISLVFKRVWPQDCQYWEGPAAMSAIQSSTVKAGYEAGVQCWGNDLCPLLFLPCSSTHHFRAVWQSVQGFAAARGGVCTSSRQDNKENIIRVRNVQLHARDDHHVWNDAP